MTDIPLVPLLVRWLHLLCFALALGTPLFLRFVLQPSAKKTLDEEARVHLTDSINAKWRIAVYLMITVFILTGLYNYLAVSIPMIRPWPVAYKMLYHSLLGFKLLLALWVFVLASALPGRTKTFAFIRQRSRLFLSALIVLLLIILMMSNSLRALRDTGLKRYAPPAATPTTSATPTSAR